MAKSLKYECLKPKYNMQTYERFAQRKYIKNSTLQELQALQIAAPQLIEQFFNGEYKWSIPEKALLKKLGTNRKRTVYMYSLQDRYIMGILYRAFSAYFAGTRNSHCFSYATGISTSTAVKYIRSKMTEEICGVKIDIHAYFNSVNRMKLVEMLHDLFKGNVLLELEQLMLDDRVMFGGEMINEYKSLIPGSPLASFFANYCLKDLDDELDKRNIVFARYSDDIIILGSDKAELQSSLDFIINKISEYGLEINPDKYKWFEKGENFDFLGLKLSIDGQIDVADHSLLKMKNQFTNWCAKERENIKLYNKDFYMSAQQVIKRWNYKNFKCYINKTSSFGWCHYAFRYITTTKSLEELDTYIKNVLYELKTGKSNSVLGLTDIELKAIGWVSLVDLYNLYRADFDYYCEVIDLM